MNNSQWTITEVPLINSGDVISFGSEGFVAIAGQSAIAVSRDGGRNWQALRGGKGTNMFTTDGGKTYQNEFNVSSIDVGKLCSLESAVFVPAGRLFLSTTCDHSSALWSVPIENSSDVWHVRSFAPSNKQYEVDENAAYYTPGRNLLVAGERVLVDGILREGTCVLTTNDQGASWYKIWCDSNSVPIIALDFLDDRQGWMLLANGELSRTANGGRDWVMVSGLPAQAVGHVLSLDFVNQTIGFISGENGLILTTKDGGSTWKRQISETTSSLFRVAAADEKKAWAVGEKGAVLETNDGGTTWHKASLNLDQDISNLTVKDGAAWFVLGNRVYRKS